MARTRRLKSYQERGVFLMVLSAAVFYAGTMVTGLLSALLVGPGMFGVIMGLCLLIADDSDRRY